MSLIDYQKEIAEIEQQIDKKRSEEIESFIKNLDERLETEKQNIIEAFNNYWILRNGALPSIDDKELTISKITSQALNLYGSDSVLNIELKQSTTRNDKIRDIISACSQGSEITAKNIFEEFQKKYPDLAPELATKITLISKELRKMERKGKLEKIQEGSGGRQTIYRKF